MLSGMSFHFPVHLPPTVKEARNDRMGWGDSPPKDVPVRNTFCWHMLRVGTYIVEGNPNTDRHETSVSNHMAVECR